MTTVTAAPVPQRMGTSANRPSTQRQQNLQQIAFQEGEDGLGLGVAEAGVELQHARAVGCQHEPCEEDADIGHPLGGQPGDRGREDGALDLGPQAGREEGGRREGPHAARVGALVAFAQPLVVLCGRHHAQRFAIGEGEHGDFGAGQALFDDDGGARRTEALFDEHRVRDLGRLDQRGGQDDALAGSQSAGLDDRRRVELAQVAHGFVEIGECRRLRPSESRAAA